MGVRAHPANQDSGECPQVPARSTPFCPIRITKILTDNGKEFTDRLFASRARAASGSHEFDQLCAELGIEHRLTPPKSPQTNGMVERFNGRIADVLKTNRFDSALDLEQTLILS